MPEKREVIQPDGPIIPETVVDDVVRVKVTSERVVLRHTGRSWEVVEHKGDENVFGYVDGQTRRDTDSRTLFEATVERGDFTLNDVVAAVFGMQGR